MEVAITNVMNVWIVCINAQHALLTHLEFMTLLPFHVIANLDTLTMGLKYAKVSSYIIYKYVMQSVNHVLALQQLV